MYFLNLIRSIDYLLEKIKNVMANDSLSTGMSCNNKL